MRDRIRYRLDVSPLGHARGCVRAASTCTVPIPAGADMLTPLDARVESAARTNGTPALVTITPAGRTPAVSFDWPGAASPREDADGAWTLRLPRLQGPAEVEVFLPRRARVRRAVGHDACCGVWCGGEPTDHRTVRFLVPPQRDAGTTIVLDYSL